MNEQQRQLSEVFCSQDFSTIPLTGGTKHTTYPLQTAGFFFEDHVFSELSQFCGITKKSMTATLADA